MKSTFKKVIALATMSLLAISVAACAKKTDEKPAEPAKPSESTSAEAPSAEAPAGNAALEAAEIVLWGSQEDQQFLSQMVQNFNAKPEYANIKVDIRVQGEDKAREAVQNDPEAAADVFGIPHDQLGELVKGGIVYENTKYADELKANTIDAAITASMFDGKMYGYPNAAETYFMYYNKSIFSEDDVKSLDKMLEVAQGKNTKIGSDLGNAYFSVGYYFTAGSNLFGEDGSKPDEVTFNNAGGLEVTKYLGGLKARGMLPISDGEATALLQNGELAAMVTGSWKSNDYLEALGDNFAVAPLPTINYDGTDKQLMSFSGMKLYLVKSKTKAPLQAMALANYLCSEEVQKAKFEARNALPVAKSLQEWDAIKKQPIAQVQIQQLNFSRPMPSQPNMGMFWNFMNPFLTDVVNGAIPPAEYQSKLDELCKKIVEG